MAAWLWPPHAAANEAKAASPAVPGIEIGLVYFEESLSPYGRWFSHPVWGRVWQPEAGKDFRPYVSGSWQFTREFGWLWRSDEPFGDIVYHYGRWIFDPDYGWLWVPGYVWGPSWVIWRQTDGYIGWLPMPPAYGGFEPGPGSASYALDGWYGYQNYYGASFVQDAFFNLWVFVASASFGDEERRHHVRDKRRLRDLYKRSRDCTNYISEAGHIVDHSVDAGWLRTQTHRAIDAQPAAQFLRSDPPVTSIDEGRQIGRNHRAAALAQGGTPLSRNSGSAGVERLGRIDRTSISRAATARTETGARIVPSPGNPHPHESAGLLTRTPAERPGQRARDLAPAPASVVDPLPAAGQRRRMAPLPIVSNESVTTIGANGLLERQSAPSTDDLRGVAAAGIAEPTPSMAGAGGAARRGFVGARDGAALGSPPIAEFSAPPPPAAAMPQSGLPLPSPLRQFHGARGEPSRSQFPLRQGFGF